MTELRFEVRGSKFEVLRDEPAALSGKNASGVLAPPSISLRSIGPPSRGGTGWRLASLVSSMLSDFRLPHA